MDTDIRPQDDLFGHVNGRWLAETEIPSDRSSWGPFVQLADVCEQQVRDIITDLADGVRGRAPRRCGRRGRRRQRPQDRRPLQLVHGHRADRDPRARPGPRAARSGVRPARRPRPGGVPRRVRAGRRLRRLRLVRRHRRPQLRPLPVPHRPGRPRAAGRELLPRRQVRRDPRGLRRLPHQAAHPRRATPTPRVRPSGSSRSTPSWPRATGSGPRPATSRRPTTCAPPTSSRRCARRSTGTPTSPTSAGT